jgi:hypothetical protein
MLRNLGLASLAIAASATTAGAAPILQDQATGASQIQVASPIGQSFTAEDAHVSIGFFIEDFNPNLAPSDDDVTITLYAGEGTGGAVLGSGDVTGLTLGFQGWVDVDFSSVALTLGAVYTAIISDDTVRWGVATSWGNPYAGGQLYWQGAAASGSDARFRVLPQQVPEPLTLVLAGLGLAGVAVRRRR